MSAPNNRQETCEISAHSPVGDHRVSRRFNDDAEWIATVIVELRRALRRANAGQTKTAASSDVRTESARSKLPPGDSTSPPQRPHSQSEVMRFIGRHPGAGTGTIATGLRLNPNTVSALCSTLVKRGELRRERDPQDGRAAQFFLTEERQVLRYEKFDHRSDVVSEALDTMNPVSREKLRHALPALDELIDALERTGC